MKPWSFSTFASGCLVVLIVFMTQGQPPKNQTAPASPVLIRTGRLLDVQSGTYKSDQGVMIEGGYIKEVDAFTTIRKKSSKTVRIVDLGRAALLPGLIDCHSHLFSAEAFIKDNQQQSLRRTQLAVQAKVKIAAGSDMVFIYPGKTRGQASIVNLEALRSQGLTVVDVIRAATINAAELLGISAKVGAIELETDSSILYWACELV